MAKLSNKTLSKLPPALPQRVRHLRELLGVTPAALAKKASIELTELEDIEAGLILFLPIITRQKLARALRVPSGVLLESEKRPAPSLSSEPSIPNTATALQHILRTPENNHVCPLCQKPLHIRLFDRQDLEGNPIRAIKIHCSACLFRFESE